MKGKEVISAEEAVEKIRAAAEARKDPDFIIKSRTDTLATHGISEVSAASTSMPRPAPTCSSPTPCCRFPTSRPS